MISSIQTLSLIISFSLGFFFMTEEDLAKSYIEQHKHLAVAEMYRTGIPASITLAQALHESNNGKSPLAINANNHFGIKCKSYWTGPTYQHKDDDYKNGKLIKSCFRSYSSTIDSYKDHSEFLMQSYNYAALFKIDKVDYINWAHGLKKAGYATDPDYAIKLIKKIEKYQLYDLDYYEKAVKSKNNFTDISY